MKQRSFLMGYAEIADIHAMRLSKALMQVNRLMPISASILSKLPDQQLAFLDMMTIRFSKLQDIIGSKILPLILEILKEDAHAFIDNANLG